MSVGDNVVKPTADNRREYPIVVVNTSDKPGVAVYTLARSLSKRLSDIAANDPSLSVSVKSLGSNRSGSPSWAIAAESTDNVKRYLLSEFHLSPTNSPKFTDYFLWILRTPVRAAKYLWYQSCESMGPGSRRQRTRRLVGIFLNSLLISILVPSYLYLMLFLSFVVVYPLRRLRVGMVTLYLLAITSLVVLFASKSLLVGLVLGISHFTQQLLSLANDPKLSFDLLFPVMAAAILGVAVSIVVFLIGLLRQVIPEADEWMFPAQGTVDFAYLLDPLYAAKARGAFEEMILDVVNKEETKSLFVVSEHAGILLAYEVLSRACPGKMNKPVHLLTRNFDVAGLLRINLSTILWLFVEPINWSRFARTTPSELLWHHWTPWPSNEFTLKIDSAPRGRLPHVQRKLVKTSWKSSYSTSVNRLIALTDQGQ